MASKRTKSELPASPRVRRTRSAGAAHSAKSTSLADPVIGTTSVSEPNQSEPDRDEIARLAYSFWESRGGEGGSPHEDWLRAESELRNRRTLTASA
ncbi:MAG: DUF2934 domain-containing protein [Bryobacteraceae bacterium]